MMIRYLGIVLVFIGSAALAQDTRNVEPVKAPAPAYQATKKQKKKGLFGSRKKNKLPNRSEDPVGEFRSRLQKVYKQRAKEEKKMEKPRYSDPTYFGHKRPPKKRPVGKQKFCKICKIKH